MENIKEKTCAFTGHRPERLGFGYNEKSQSCVAFKVRLRRILQELIENEGFTYFLSGGAMGMDMYAAEAVLDLKARYPHICLEMVIPCPQQADRWSPAMRLRYNNILARCDKKTVLSPVYYDGVMQVRNRYLVDHAGLLLAAYDGKNRGGTAMTVHYAQKTGVRVRNEMAE